MWMSSTRKESRVQKQNSHFETQKTNCLEHLFLEPPKQEQERNRMKFRVKLGVGSFFTKP